LNRSTFLPKGANRKSPRQQIPAGLVDIKPFVFLAVKLPHTEMGVMPEHGLEQSHPAPETPNKACCAHPSELIKNLNFESKFTNDCSKSDDFKSMVAKASLVAENAKRLVNAYYYRPETEFIDIQSDPLELNNLATEPAWKLKYRVYRKSLKNGCPHRAMKACLQRRKHVSDKQQGGNLKEIGICQLVHRNLIF